MITANLAGVAPPFQANILWAIIAGMIGSLVFTVLVYIIKAVSRNSNINVDIPFMLGSFVVDIDKKSKLYTVGIILNTIMGGLWGMIYVITMLGLSIPPIWQVGFLWGMAHGIISGVLVSTICQNHPYMGKGKEIPNPGILGSNWSEVNPYLYLSLHIIFAVVTIFIYQLAYPVITL